MEAGRRARPRGSRRHAGASPTRRAAKRKIAPWDYRYYAEKVRKAKYDLDQNEVKPYLQLEKLREGMFWVAGELFGFAFTPRRRACPVYHPDVRVWEVKDKPSGKHVGLWYFDPYARPGKRSGAWMNAYRAQERFDGEVTTIVSNNANFVKGKPGEPVLISWDDARTLFHEFGHALHGLELERHLPVALGHRTSRATTSSSRRSCSSTGCSTPRGAEPLRAALPDRRSRSRRRWSRRSRRRATFNQGFDTVEYLAARSIDMKLHLAGDDDDRSRRVRARHAGASSACRARS